MDGPYGLSDEEALERAPSRYSLKGPQVEPEAAYWTFSGVRFEVIDVDDLPANTIPAFRSSSQALELDFSELERLQELRTNAAVERALSNRGPR